MSWAVTGDVGKCGPAMNLNVFTWLQNIQTKKFINTVKGIGSCSGENSLTIKSSVFENLRTIQMRRFFNTVKCPGPCLGEHDQPFIWTLLNVCITSKRNDSSTPGTELGRDRGCWGARPSYKLECFYMAAEHPDKQNFQHRKQNWAVFGGAQPSHRFECFWKVSYHPDEKVLQHREMPWTVFGGAQTSVHLNVVDCLHNIKTKRFFNAAKRAKPGRGMLGSAAQPSTWMSLIGCITSRRKGSSTPWKELSRVWRSTAER